MADESKLGEGENNPRDKALAGAITLEDLNGEDVSSVNRLTMAAAGGQGDNNPQEGN